MTTSRARTHPSTSPRAGWRPLVLLALAGLLTTVLTGAAAAPPRPGELFVQHELAAGRAESLTLLPGRFLAADGAELAVLSAGRPHHHLRIYRLRAQGWSPVFERPLGPDVAFVDVAHIAGRDRLLTYEAGGRLAWLDPNTPGTHTLLHAPIRFRAHDQGAIPRLPVARDLNGNGRDDLILPDVEGFWVSTQERDGTFTDPVALGPPEPFRHHSVGGLDLDAGPTDPARTYGEVGITPLTAHWYLGRVHQADLDLDGRSELLFWDRDHFAAHHQDHLGHFAAPPRSVTVEVPLAADGVYSRLFDFADQGAASALLGRGVESEATVLYGLRDLDGDRIADLVTLTLAGRSLVRQRGRYEVRYGAPSAGGVTAFAAAADTTIEPRDRAVAMAPWGYSSALFHDFDGDGRLEALFRYVRVGVLGMARALIGNSVPLDLELYRHTVGGYPQQPTAVHRIRRFAPLAGWGNVFFPPVLVGDVDGDGRTDLLAGQGPQRLHIYLGVPGPTLLAREPRTVRVELPPDERDTRLVDLDRDGKHDLLVHHRPTGRNPGAPHRITTLIAR